MFKSNLLHAYKNEVKKFIKSLIEKEFTPEIGAVWSGTSA